MPKMKAGKERNVLLTVFVTIFLDLLGFGIIIPILPFYAQQFGASAPAVTWLGASYSLMQLIFAPFWGRLSDRYGRRPIMLVSIAASIVGYGLFALATDLTMLFAARLLAGFGNANIATAQAAIADTTTPQTRARGMGLIGAAFGLGFIVGPAAGGLLGQISPSAPAWLATGLAAINLLMAYFLFHETLPEQHRGQVRARVSWSRVLSIPALTSVLMVNLLLTSGFSMIEQTLALLIEAVWVSGDGVGTAGLASGSPEAWRLGAARTAQYLLFVGITSSIVQGGLLGGLTRRFGEKRLIGAGLLLILVGFVLISVVSRVSTFGVFMVTAVLLAAGTGLSTPSLSGLISKLSPPDIQGRALGLGQSASALGRVIGPGISGYLFEVGIRVPFETAAVIVGVAFAALLAVPADAGQSAPEELSR